MPTARAIPAMRQKTSIVANQSRGLLRPSSGYYGYASRRTDSDTESGRFSSTNVRKYFCLPFLFFFFTRLNLNKNLAYFVYHPNRAFHQVVRRAVLVVVKHQRPKQQPLRIEMKHLFNHQTYQRHVCHLLVLLVN